MSDTTPKPFVFILMPFDAKFNDIYQLGIKAACAEAGGYCERVDEQFFENSILDRVYNQIAKADLIVADMTERNPNVFYEVGYAHALGKRVILLTQVSQDIPFDLKHYPHIVYGGKITELKQELAKRIRWALENPGEVKRLSEEHLDLYVYGENILKHPALKLSGSAVQGQHLQLTLEMNNSTEKFIGPITFKIGLLCKEELNFSPLSEGLSSTQFTTINLKAHQKNLYIIDRPYEILPGCWEKMHFYVFRQAPYQVGQLEELVFRVFSNTGTADYPLNLMIS